MKYTRLYNMEIAFYYNNSDSKVVNKSLSNNLGYSNANLKAPCDILAPVIIVKYNNAIFSRNYAYIPAFKRYYYVIGKQVLKGTRLELQLQVDVLMSWKDDILNSSQLVVRSESVGKPTYVVDSNYPIRQAGYNDVIKFSAGIFNSGQLNNTSFNYVINVAGGNRQEA